MTTRSLLALMVCALLTGCSRRYDPRLNGTWRSNQQQTVAAAFQRDPRWTNASPEKVAKFRNLFGHMALTYSNDMIWMVDRGMENVVRYRVMDRGPDYVVIRTDADGLPDGFQDTKDLRIRFVDAGNGYWVHSGKLLGMEMPEERFDRVTEPTGVATQAQPSGANTNRMLTPGPGR